MAAHTVLQAIKQWCKNKLQGGKPFGITIKEKEPFQQLKGELKLDVKFSTLDKDYLMEKVD